MPGSEYCLDIGFDIEEICIFFLDVPSQFIDRPPSHTREHHGLVQTFDRLQRVLGIRAFMKHPTYFKNPHTRSFAIRIEFDHLKQ